MEVLKDLVTSKKSERTDKDLNKSKTKDERDKARKPGVPWFLLKTRSADMVGIRFGEW